VVCWRVWGGGGLVGWGAAGGKISVEGNRRGGQRWRSFWGFLVAEGCGEWLTLMWGGSGGRGLGENGGGAGCMDICKIWCGKRRQGRGGLYVTNGLAKISIGRV